MGRGTRAGATGEQKRRATPATAKASGAARPPRYDVRGIEERWRTEWAKRRIYEPDLRTATRPYYNLMMFPYPSAGGLHVGNMYAFVGADIHGRWQAMRGHDVFEPMGFDAFGIHSENFAIKSGIHPAELTRRSTANFRRQLESMGNRFDWSHAVDTTDPRYYRWTQWIFVQLCKAGLAEKREAPVNWCPNDKTVLADEQVINGHCERCGALVERRMLSQWFLKITRYADRLLANLETLDWSERVTAAQRNWIGRSEGLEFSMPVEGQPDAQIAVYTTRPDTIYGVTFAVLAPEHPLAVRIADEARRAAVAAYVAEAQRRGRAVVDASEQDVTGIFTGAHVTHPVTGERLPVWVSDYVLGEYGTGAIMAVPAHDARDLRFARAMGLPVRPVVRPPEVKDAALADEAYTQPGVLVDSGSYTGIPSEQAAEAIIAAFEASGTGRRRVTYHLRDWLISRQRYWGPPIPIIYCSEHGAVPVPEDQLPVELPYVADFAPRGTGSSPLAGVASFVETECPICGGPARRETDVSDNFLDSAWYYLRYPSAGDDTAPWDAAMTRKWLPVDMYIGGAEHSVLHLLYARFITMALHDLGHLPFAEPFVRFRAHGIITRDGEKIAKSRGNLIQPDEYIDRYGADVFRMYLMFMGPYDAGGDFSDRGIGGVVRFAERVYWLVTAHHDAPEAQPEGEAARRMQRVIKRVTDDIGELKYHTAIAALMEYSGSVESAPVVTRGELETLLALLAPFAPYLTEELWHQMGHAESIHTTRWPRYDEQVAGGGEVTVVVQVNGRVRDRFTAAAGTPTDVLREAALATPGARRFVAGAAVARVVVVPGRLVNIVTA